MAGIAIGILVVKGGQRGTLGGLRSRKKRVRGGSVQPLGLSSCISDDIVEVMAGGAKRKNAEELVTAGT